MKTAQSKLVTLEFGKKTNYYRKWDSFGVFSHVWADCQLMAHPYFKAENGRLGLDIEVAASGFFYYYNSLLVGIDPKQVSYSKQVIIASIKRGLYHTILTCNLPYQKPVKEIEDFISNYWEAIRGVEPEVDNEYMLSRCQALKKSVTLPKLQRLLRWGYKQARNLIPCTPANLLELRSFLAQMDKVTAHSDYHIAQRFKSFEIEIKEGKELEWDAYFYKHDDTIVNYRQFLNDASPEKE